MTGEHLEINLRWSVAPGHEQDYSKVIVTVIDITERKQTEQALRESEERFSKAFEFAPIGKALVSLDGGILKVNQAMCRCLGYTEQELISKTFQELTHPEDLDSDLGYLHQMIAGEIPSYQMEKRYFHKNGSIVWALLSASVVRDRKPAYAISQIEDITKKQIVTVFVLEISPHSIRRIHEKL